jgi:hypothetical protein
LEHDNETGARTDCRRAIGDGPYAKGLTVGEEKKEEEEEGDEETIGGSQPGSLWAMGQGRAIATSRCSIDASCWACSWSLLTPVGDEGECAEFAGSSLVVHIGTRDDDYSYDSYATL